MKEKAVIFFGGKSDERLVSVASAQNMSESLPDADLWFLDRNGKVFFCTCAELLRHSDPFRRDFIPASKSNYSSIDIALDDPKNSERVFVLAFHGSHGEDGKIQLLFEERGIAFTGSGSTASHNAFDKRIAKQIALENKLPIAPEMEVKITQDPETEGSIRRMLSEHKDIVLKPVASGSSIGLFRVRDEKSLSEALRSLQAYSNERYLLEPFLHGTEVTIGVHDSVDGLKALPVSEIRVEENHNFDYEGKYLGRGTVEITPAEITSSLSLEVQKMALLAHQMLRCFGYSRTDAILTDNGPVYLETNTLPGLSKASFIPQQLKVAGISFREFLNRQIELAKGRQTKTGISDKRAVRF